MVSNPTVAGFDLATERIVRFAFYPRTAERVGNNFGGPLAAVRHRHDSIFASGKFSRRPAAIASPTSRALSVPLNLSGAIKMRTRYDFNFRSKISPANCGFALPLDNS